VYVHQQDRRANWLFADTHAKSYKLIQTIQPTYRWRNPDDRERRCTPGDIPVIKR
jgi:prepilin-type processing-associated H-X9-DG protein